MTALIDQLTFASAYRQLRPAERAFVDAAVTEMERAANRANERISLALYRPIPNTIVAQSRGMLDKPMVRAAITERINEIAAASELTIQRMVKEMMAIAFSSIGDYMTVDESGQPYFDLARCTPEMLAAIKTIKLEETGDGMERGGKRKFDIVLHDKIGGMKMLADFMGMLTPDNPHWRAESSRPAQTGTLPGTTTTEGAGDAYAAMING